MVQSCLEKPVKKSPAFMEPVVLLHFWKEPATGTYLETDESSPHRPTLYFDIRFNIILLCTTVFPKWFLPFRFTE
jgi:hypothetical protein